jgi:hypothetical protein
MHSMTYCSASFHTKDTNNQTYSLSPASFHYYKIPLSQVSGLHVFLRFGSKTVVVVLLVVNKHVAVLTVVHKRAVAENKLNGSKFEKRYIGLIQHITCKCMIKQSHNTPMEAQGERRYSSYSFSTSALDGDERSASSLGRALPPGKGPTIPIVQEAGWAPEPRSGHRGYRKNPLLPPPVIEPRSPCRPVRRQTLF